MSYRVRFTTQTGATFYWERAFATRIGATHFAQIRADDTGYTYTVEEVPDAPQWKEEAPRWTRDVPMETIMKIDDESMRAFAAGPGGVAKVTKEATAAPEPGSTAAHHVEILRERVKNLEEVQKAMNQDLALAIQLGDAMRQAMRTGAWRAGDDAGMASNAIAGWDRFRPSLGKAPSVPVGASEAPGEGRDSDRRRLRVLQRFLDGDTFRQIWKTTQGNIVAGTTIEGQEYAAPTLADKLAEKEDKP